MRPLDSTSRAWLWLHLFVLWAVLMQAPPAAGQEPAAPHLTPDARTRLTEAARNSNLEPWQREFMLNVARGRTEGRAIEPGLRGLAPLTGIAANDGAWTLASSLSARYSHTAIYDPVRDRLVVFGGLDGSGRCNDVWALSLAGSPAWTALAPTGSPPSPRQGHTAIYDPLRDRVVVFGGWEGNRTNDVWALTLAGTPAWSEIVPAGTPPSPREGHTAIYDPVRDQMVVFGGWDSGRRNDTWALTLAATPAWSELNPAGSPPSGRYEHTAIYDPLRDRMVVFGGHDGSPRNDVWALSLAGGPAWSAIAPAGSPPSARHIHTAFYDPARDRMVVFGGFDGSPRNDVWTLTLAGSPGWSSIVPAGSPLSARDYHTAIYDPVRDRMVVFGGWDGGNFCGDAWVLSLPASPAWNVLVPAEIRPPARFFHTAIHDPQLDRMVVFGGWDNGTVYRNDLWTLSLAGSPTWSALATAGGPPPVRGGHTAIYDPLRDRMVVFGGYDGAGLRNDVWTLSLTGSPVWTPLATAGSPPTARHVHTAIYDPVRDRMVMFGGWDGSFRNDVWALSLAGSPAWSLLAPAGIPPSPRHSPAVIYDPVRDRMVMFGGWDGVMIRNDVWALSLAESPAWSALAPAGNPPSGRYYHSAIYDPLRDRMVMFGGFDGSYHNDVWALALAGSLEWSALAPAGMPPTERIYHTAIYDPLRDRSVVFGGFDETVRGDLWMLGWDTPVSVAQDMSQRLRLGVPRPNRSRGVTFVDFELGEPAQMALDVFDVHGRLVKRIAHGWFPAGRHASTWRGDDDRGHALGSGVYLIRLQGSGVLATRRTVRVR